MIILLTLLLIKHFILDFYYQPPYMWQNKGTFGHMGGIAHAGLHAMATFVILTFWLESPIGCFALAYLEFCIHYMTDWAKMNINRIKGWGATTHTEFWQLTGLDQLIHQLTYVMILWVIYG